MNRIPKKLHMYWDKSPMSRLQVFTIETFHKLNPDWKIFVYMPKQGYTRNAHYIPDYTGKDFFNLIESFDYVKIIEIDINDYYINGDLHNILRSDIFRCHILYDVGGVWSDFDVIWLKPLTHMLNVEYVGDNKINDMGAMVCLFNTIKGHHNVGVLFSAPKHGMYSELIEAADNLQQFPENFPKFYYDRDTDTYNHQAFGVLLWEYLYKTFIDVSKKYDDVVGLKYETFAPYSIYNMEQLFMRNDLSPLNSNNVIGVHWFNGHKYSKQYINDNWFSKNQICSLTTILKANGYVDV